MLHRIFAWVAAQARRHLKMAVLLGLSVLTVSAAQPDMQQSLPTRALCRDAQPIALQGYVPIGGIEQWLSIRSADCRQPIILFLHGGPANPISPFAAQIYAGWEQEFTLVQWDQRASGRTWLRNQPQPGERLTMAQMVADGLAVTRYLQRVLGPRPVILMGSSWGSALGVSMVQQQPSAFVAFIGSSQLLSGAGNELASYQAVLHYAKAHNDQQALAQLAQMGPPPFAKPHGKLRRLSRAYEAQLTTPAPKTWWQGAAEYDLARFASDYEAAEDYSFVQYMGFDINTGKTGVGIYQQLDLPRSATKFALPVYFVQGAQDLVTVPALVQAYVQSIEAPHKELIMVQGAGHSPNAASIAAEFALLQRIKQQLAAGTK